MASDSHTPTATTPEKPLEDKVSEEAKLMEKEIVSSDSADVVNDKPASDSNPSVTKEKETDQTPAGEPEKESPAVVEDVGAVAKTEESTDTKKYVNGEKVAEQVELIEPVVVKEGVEEVHVEAVDVEKTEEKATVESVVEEDNKDKEETKIVDVSESTDEAGGKQVEPVDVQSVTDISAETAEDNSKYVDTLEVDPKPEASEKFDSQPEKEKELAPEVEVVKAEETPETTEQAEVGLEGKVEDIIVEAKDSGLNSKDEKTSESSSNLCPEEIVLTNQESEADLKKETEGDASSSVEVIEKAIAEEKHIVDEPSKDEKTSESGAALFPEKVVATNEVTDTNPKGETEVGASSPADVIERAITEEKHVVEEPSKDEKSSDSGPALCPEKVVPTNQDSDIKAKEETGGDVSSADVTEKAITEVKHVVEEPSNGETSFESGSALCPEKVVPTNEDSDTNTKKEAEGDVSSPADVIEKAITEEKHVVEEPSKDEQENVTEAKDVVTKLATECENIKIDTEPVSDGKSEEILKETETESGEKETAANKQEESKAEKVGEVIETAPAVKASDEQNQEPEVTTKEVAVKQKSSNSIISKVKQSLVKAKKAIIGKSPSSKTISTEEVKGEINVK